MFVPAITWGQSANSYYIEASIDLSCSCIPSYTSFGVVYANGQSSTKPFTNGTLSTSFLVYGDIHTFNGGFTLNACNGQPAGGGGGYAPQFTPGTYNYSGSTPTAACPNAKVIFTVDDPVYLSVVALHMDASQTSTFKCSNFNTVSDPYGTFQYREAGGSWVDGSTTLGPGATVDFKPAAFTGCSKSYYFRVLKTLKDGTVTYGNELGPYTFYNPPQVMPDAAAIVCEGSPIGLKYDCGSPEVNLKVGAGTSPASVTWQNISKTISASDKVLNYSDIDPDGTKKWKGQQIWVRPYYAYSVNGNSYEIPGQYFSVVFLPQANLSFTPSIISCNGDNNATITLKCNEIPDKGATDPNNAPVKLLISIWQYGTKKIAPDADSIQYPENSGRFFYYNNGKSIEIPVTGTNTIVLDNTNFGGFTLGAGVYNITAKFDITTANCPKDQTFQISEPPKLEVKAFPVTLNNTTYSVRTGETTGTIQFDFKGGTPPYYYMESGQSPVQVNDNGTGGTDSYGRHIGLASTTTTASKGVHTYYLYDSKNCKQTTAHHPNLEAPPDVALTNLPSTPVNCNQNDASGTKNNGTVSVTISGGVPGYTAELWKGTKLTSKAASAGTVTFTNSDYPITEGTYEIRVRDNLNPDLPWGSGDIKVDEPGALTVTPTPVHPTCHYLNNGSISLTPGGGNGTYQYTVSKGGASVTNYTNTLSEGVYSITVTDAKSCTQTTTATLIDPLELKLTATYSQHASCAAVNNGTALAEVTNFRNSHANVSFKDSKGNPLSATHGSGNYFTITGLSDTARMEIFVSDIFCSASDSVKIPLRSSPFDINISTTSLAPCTGKNGTITIATENGELPADSVYKYYVNGGNLKENASPSETYSLTGNIRYTFTVIDGVGCPVTKSDVVTVRSDSLRLNKTAVVNGAWCTSSNTGNITIQKESGTGNISFRLTPTDSVKQSTSGTIFYNLFPKTYKIVASDTYLCKDSITVPVPVRNDSLRLASYNSVKAVCRESSPTGVLKISRYVNGKKTGFGDVVYTLNSPPQADTTFAGLRSGWYTVTATDNRGCTVSISDSVKFADNPVNLDTLWITHQRCNEVQNARIKLIASTKSGTEPLYRFVYGQDTTAWRADTITYPLNTAGNYTFKVIDKNNCGNSRTETIKNLKYAPKPVLEYSLPVACANALNGELKVYNLPHHSQPKYRYILGTDIAYTTSPNERVVFSGLKKGDHIVTIRDTLGCQDTAKFTVYVESDSLHIANINTIPATCIAAQNGQSKIVASSFDKSATANKYTFECYNKILSGDSVTFTSLPVNKTGLYPVKVTDRYGCKNTGSFAINVLKDTLNLEFRALKDAACPGSSDGWMKLRRSFGNEKFRYSLLSGTGYSRVFELTDTLVSINNLPYGTYTITVKDTNKCVARVENIEINQPDTIRFLSFYNNYVKRKGEPEGILSATIWKGNGKYNYEWYNVDKNIQIGKGQTYQNTKLQISNLYAGNYLLKVRDTANCIVSPTGWLEKQFTVIEPEKALELSIVSNKAASCYGLSDGAFTIKAKGGWGENYLYGLDAGHMDISGLFTGHVAGTLAAFAKDTSGVIVSIPVTISQPEPLTASFSQKTDANCFGASDGSIQANISGGNYPHYLVSADNLHWTKGNTLSGLSKGSYTVYIRDTLHCKTSLPLPVIIDQPSEISVISSKITDTRCMFANGTITTEIGGGIPGYTFLWNDESGNKVPGEGSNAVNLYSGTYRLNVTDNHSCLKVFPFNVSDITDLTIDRVDTVSVSCWGYSDGKASLAVSKGNPPYTITWPDNSHSTTVTGLQSGDYTVRVDDKERCKVFRNFVIGSPSRIVLESKTLISPYCEGVEDGKISVNAIGSFGNYSYLWSNGKEGNNISKLKPGTYKLTITDSHNCFNNFDFALDYQHTIKPSLGYDRNLCNGNSLWLTPGEYITYKWGSNTGVGSSETGINVNNAGRYFVEVSDYENCIGRDTINIGVSSTEMEGKLLVATNVAQNDTVVLFQASWPFPDSVKFHPEGCRIIETGRYYRKVVYPDTGTYVVGLTSYLKDCEDIVTKTIHVEERETKLKKSSNRLIQSFNISPNPNHGQFNVEIQLQEPADIQLRLANLGTGVISDIRSYKGMATYCFPYSLNLPSGTYMLHLQCKNDARSKTLLIVR